MVAIKDMEMPKSCFDCSFCELPGSLCVCKAGHFTYERKKEFTKRRHPNCPLIEIKNAR